MKVIILISYYYTLKDIFYEGFYKLGHEVKIVPFESLRANWKNKFEVKFSGFPYKIKRIWEEPFIKEINKKYLEIIKEYKPDLVFVYNDQKLLPETVKEIKKTSKVCFFLGDNPYYNFTNPHNLALLHEADYIASPDTGWIEQLKLIGINNIHFHVFGYNPSVNYKKNISNSDQEKFASDLVFIGRTYRHSWGYKRSLFLNQFIDFDFKIYTHYDVYWKKWLKYFPDLTKKIIFLKSPLSNEQVNTIYNCCKICPIDANPGLINGMHIRIFDCIGSEILPLPEYRTDIVRVFKDVEIPIIQEYKHARDLAMEYLNNEEKRIYTVKELKKYVDSNYSPSKCIKNLVDSIFN